MDFQDTLSLLPLLILGGGAILVMGMIAVRRSHRLVHLLAMVILAAAFGISAYPLTALPRIVGPLLVVDGFSLTYFALITGATFVVGYLSYPYLEQFREQKEEYYLLLILSAMGGMILVAARHFVSLFLGLELLSVSLYVLIGYMIRSRDRSIEAGAKYLVLAGASSAFLLFGMALLFFETGEMAFISLGAALMKPGMISLPAMAGLGLMLVAIGFKLALVPFHMWIPDVYEGAPAPVSALVATVSKIAVVGVLFRWFDQVQGHQYSSLVTLLSIFAIASMLGGNLLALLQKNVKRILAYSSVAHLGYLMVALLAAGEMAAEAVTFYLVVYVTAMLGAFGTVSYLTQEGVEAETVTDFQSLFWERPWVAFLFTTVLLSLAGIPLTAGFFGKFYLVAAGVASQFWLLLIVLLLSSAIGLFYYLRIVVAMFRHKEAAPKPALRWTEGSLILTLLLFLLLWWGVFPEGLMRLVSAWMGG